MFINDKADIVDKELVKIEMKTCDGTLGALAINVYTSEFQISIKIQVEFQVKYVKLQVN